MIFAWGLVSLGIMRPTITILGFCFLRSLVSYDDMVYWLVLLQMNSEQTLMLRSRVMEDVFYFTKSKIDVLDIMRVAIEAGYKVPRGLTPLPEDPCEQARNVNYVKPETGEDRIWRAETMSAECGHYGGWPEASLQRVSDYGPASAFSISYTTTQDWCICWPHS